MAVELGKAATDCVALNLKSSWQPAACSYAAVAHDDGSPASRRPLLTVGLSPDSGSNVPVTCRSTGSHFERQLLHRTNSHNRPEADGQRFEKLTYSVELVGAVRFYHAASSDQRERGRDHIRGSILELRKCD